MHDAYRLIQQGVGALKNGEVVHGLGLIEHALAIDPLMPDGLYLRAAALARLGRVSEALAAARTCLEHHSGHSRARELIGYLETHLSGAPEERGHPPGMTGTNSKEAPPSRRTPVRPVDLLLEALLFRRPGWPDPREWLDFLTGSTGGAVGANGRVGSREAGAAGDLELYQEAGRSLEAMVAAGRTDLEPVLAALSVHEGFVREAVGDLEGALASHNRALDIYDRWTRLPARGDMGVKLGESLLHLANVRLALADHRMGFALADRAIQVLEPLAVPGAPVGRPGAPLPGTSESQPLAEQLARALTVKAIAMRRLGHVRESLAFCDRAITLRRQLVEVEGYVELSLELARSWIVRAAMLDELRDHSGALALFEQAVRMVEQWQARTPHPDAERLIALGCLGAAGALRARETSPRTLELYGRAVTFLEPRVQAGERELAAPLAMASLSLANAYQLQHSHLDARRCYELSIRTWEQLVRDEGRQELARNLAVAYMNFAIAVGAGGDRSRAQALFDQAQEQFEALVDRGGHRELAHELALVLRNKAQLLLQADDFEGALKLSRRALEIYDQLIQAGRQELSPARDRAVQLNKQLEARWQGLSAGARTPSFKPPPDPRPPNLDLPRPEPRMSVSEPVETLEADDDEDMIEELPAEDRVGTLRQPDASRVSGQWRPAPAPTLADPWPLAAGPIAGREVRGPVELPQSLADAPMGWAVNPVRLPVQEPDDDEVMLLYPGEEERSSVGPDAEPAYEEVEERPAPAAVTPESGRSGEWFRTGEPSDGWDRSSTLESLEGPDPARSARAVSLVDLPTAAGAPAGEGRAAAPELLDSAAEIALLIVREGTPDEVRCELLEEVVTIGRARDNIIQIPDDLKMSRHHCRIRRDFGRWFLEHIGTSNETFVDGRPVRPLGTLELRGGEEVIVGETVLRFLAPDTGRSSALPTTVEPVPVHPSAFQSGLIDAVSSPVGSSPARGRSAYLIRHAGSPEEDRYQIRDDVTSIGRARDNPIQLANDIRVSRYHCRILREEGRWYVEDNHSANGTTVDGHPVGRRELRGGELIGVGETSFRFELR